ncbi:phosphoglycolate phosphatase [Paucibacter sp. PLA-PC-4]|uniref:phosphoglycolate phosphatase n=1 Tax=Paucibacter sp. PLA-PC-4 TaxID=2993655 RepID=UPI00224B2905|nr:phosphoglycolate phosphatase [Paucibacter sp. PLA-PC-4]MCX2865537.1 phosphoglycolate phosphatase [Paucibacter sp. PLA-PC-4]
MSAVLAPAASLAHVRAVLFDLDGTLIDSAPDLAGSANEMRIERGLDPLPYEALRPMVGSGARGMLGRALDIGPAHPDYEVLRADFLDRYERRMLRLTAVFDAMQPVLHALSVAAMPWAIVTNKAERFALPMTRALGLFEQSGVVIGGDTTPHAKPHPGPLLEAARRLGIAPDLCVYVGDDERDVQAGRAAGMATVAAGWGYLGQGAGVETWGADIVINEPAQLLKELVLP